MKNMNWKEFDKEFDRLVEVGVIIEAGKDEHDEMQYTVDLNHPKLIEAMKECDLLPKVFGDG